MRYPKPTDRYSCEVICNNFMEIEERLIELEENGGGGSALPPVTESDNGKILQVVNGVWMLVEVVNGNTALFYEDGNEVAY